MFNQGIYSKSSSGGGTGQGITGVVANYSALPAAAAAADEFYFVESPQGTAWLPGSLGGTYYPAGLYYSNGVTWFYAESPYQATQAAVNAGVITDQFVSPFTLANATTVERPLTFSTGLTRTVNTITANISTGISGGQTIYGGTGASENLTIESTTHATKGNLLLNANQLSFTGYSATGSTASTEINRVLFTTDGRQWATGSITTQREFLITAPTYSFVAASTITNAATLAVSAAPIAGTNASITNAYSIWSQSGIVRIDDGSSNISIRSQVGTASNAAIYMNQSAATANNFVMVANSTDVAINVPNLTSGTLRLLIGNSTTAASITRYTQSYLVLGNTTGAQTAFTFTNGSGTGQTASTEISGFKVNLSATRTWAAGAITTQREFLIQAPTYAFASASTITNAATLAVTGSPTAGTNATITNSYALWIQGGISRFDGNLSLNDAVNLVFGTTTGTKIGTATTQKIGFWNTTPIVQPTTAIAASTFAANTSGIVDDTATFDGYTIGQITKALRNLGILA